MCLLGTSVGIYLIDIMALRAMYTGFVLFEMYVDRVVVVSILLCYVKCCLNRL